LNSLLSVIEETFPIPGRFRPRLPSDIAELSRLLTSARGERERSYLNRPNMLSAYLRYFLPWNVFRLCQLFSNCIRPAFSDGYAITDLGSGPLTLPIALWIAFPELRTRKLEFRCVDKSAAILEAGYKLFTVLNATPPVIAGCNWKIKTIHDSVSTQIRGKPAKLITAINVFNEIYTDIQHNEIIQNAEKAADLLCKHNADNSSILVVEPGNPQGGTFISAIRTTLINKGMYPVSPCPHVEQCPMPGTSSPHTRGVKPKWCHFAFTTDSAPLALQKLSAAAGIPKERASLSFLLAKPASAVDLKRIHPNAATNSLCVRIISDTFPIPFGKANIGCYGCSEEGMVLVTANRAKSSKLASGTVLNLPLPKNESHDPKTMALIIPLI
jgi:ribosomal protein RSM22 (predicted rRNA methylase)